MKKNDLLNYFAISFFRNFFTEFSYQLLVMINFTEMRKNIPGVTLLVILLALGSAALLDCPTGSVLKDAGCIQCTQLTNTKMPTDGRQASNVCQCQQNYRWSEDTIQCLRVDGQIGSERSAYLTNLLQDGGQGQELAVAARFLAGSCDFANGFILMNGQCVSCRLVQYSTGMALNSTACVCQNPFTWRSQTQNCICIRQQTQFLYLSNGVCSACSLIGDATVSGYCNNCSGNSFGVCSMGCINCSSIPFGTGAINGNCTCSTGYTFNYLLGQCICDSNSGYVLTESGCTACSALTDVAARSQCSNCSGIYLFNGYYCQQGSTIPHYNINTGACTVGYAQQKNPITNQTVSCACSLAIGYYSNGNSCYLCTGVTGSGLTVAGCQNCSQIQGYFLYGVTCIYCPGVPSSTGVATMNGCGCLASYFWNTLTSTCQCDWVKGYTLNRGSCLNCGNISNTVLPANAVGSCSCAPGYIWDPLNLVCGCATSGGSYLSSANGCVNCFMRGSTGKVANGSSCLCLTGFVWDSVGLVCICDNKQNFYQSPNDGLCRDCWQIDNSNGLAFSQGCGCANGFIWMVNSSSCGCPAGYVNIGATCQSCAAAIGSLSGKTVNGCSACSNGEGFFLSNGVCLVCSKLKYTTGAATTAGCRCITSSLIWVSSLNSCVCDYLGQGYLSQVVNGQFSCAMCADSLSCSSSGYSSNTIYTSIAARSGVCTSCTKQANGGCSCYPGYGWSVTYPFQCACSWGMGGYLSGSSCFNCSTLPSTGNLTALGCLLCDPSQGFLFVSFNDSCILCRKAPNSSGIATPNGCACLTGVWSSDQLACVPICPIAYCSNCNSTSSCSSCASGYIIGSSGKQCLFNCSIPNCAVCSSMTTCSYCGAGRFPGNKGTQCMYICSVANCALCNASNICSSCVAGRILANNICLFNCSISNCAKCNSTSTCSACNVGFILSQNSIQCKPSKVGSGVLASQSSSDQNSNVSLIVGTFVGGLLFVIIVLVYFKRKRENSGKDLSLKIQSVGKVVDISPNDGKSSEIQGCMFPSQNTNANASAEKMIDEKCVTEGRLQESRAYRQAQLQL